MLFSLLLALLIQDVPAGWWALLGLLVPLLVYLWNRRPARTVQVGSLRWLEAAANRRLSRLRPQQLGLFLLRALLVALLALVVARPGWQRPPRPVRGQVLLEPALLRSSVLAALRPTIDSLRRQGYELRELGPTFPRLSATRWAQLDSLPSSRAAADTSAGDNLWMRVQQAADSFPNRPLRVFTTGQLRAFQGPRPLLPARVQWQAVPTPDSAQWLQAAAFIGTDSLRLLLGRSTETSTLFRRFTVLRPAIGASVRVAGLPAFSYLNTATGPVLRAANSESVPVRTTPVRVWIAANAAGTPEARYWQAAVRAVAVGLAAPLQLTVAEHAPPTPPDWLIWLRPEALPASVRSQAAAGLGVWQIGQEPGQAVASQFVPAGQESIITVQRLDSVVSPTAETLWQDAAARPVLTRTTNDRGTIYHLHTRLLPAWSGLGESGALPALLLPLLQPATMRPAHDRRTIAPQQLPASTAEVPSAAVSVEPVPPVDVRPWLALAAALLFGLERWLAGRSAHRSSSTGTPFPA